MSVSGAKRARSFYLLLAGVVFLLDQASKWVVAHSLPLGETRRIVPGLFNLTHVRNRGAAFGLLADYPAGAILAFLVAFSAAALVLVLILLWRGPGSRLAGCGLAFILGGAGGNLVDRLRAGSVLDFLDFHLGVYRWPPFNVADSAIVVGAAALVGHVLWSRGREAGKE